MAEEQGLEGEEAALTEARSMMLLSRTVAG